MFDMSARPVDEDNLLYWKTVTEFLVIGLFATWIIYSFVKDKPGGTFKKVTATQSIT